MKIRTWIKYEEGYIPPRCRKVRYAEKEEFYDAELKEASLSDMELAFEDNAYSGKGKIYAYKNKLWAECEFREDDLTKEGKYSNALEQLVWWNANGSKFFFPRWGSSVHADRKEAVKAVKQYMTKFLLVDGKLFGVCTEPRYCIYTFGLGYNHGGSHLAVVYGYNPNIDKSAYFNALQGEEAVAEAKATALRRGDTDSVDRMKADIIVYKPELVKCKPNADHKRGGNKTLKMFEDVIESSPDALMAGLLIMGMAGKE